MNYLRRLQLARMYAPDDGKGASLPEQDAGTTEGEETTQAPGDQNPPAQKPPKTFSKEELDSIIARERAKWARQEEKKLEEARTEAERLARMTAEQRAEEERRLHEEDLARREAEITRRELHAQALETLAGKGLPSALVATLNLADAQSCNASIEAVEKAFRDAVQAGVEERMRGQTPPGAQGNTPQKGWHEMTLAEQTEMYRNDPAAAGALAAASNKKLEA